ncbi:MAG: hypothetical protein WCY11_10895 [Novosphingobium sp.]
MGAVAWLAAGAADVTARASEASDTTANEVFMMTLWRCPVSPATCLLWLSADPALFPQAHCG